MVFGKSLDHPGTSGTSENSRFILVEGRDGEARGREKGLGKGALGRENNTHLADEKIEAQVGKPGS